MRALAKNSVEKKRGRPFPKGTSGNPAGKPKGALNHATRAAALLLDNECESLTRKVIELALSGDMTALKLCLDRIIPPRKERPVSIRLPSIKGVADLPRLTAAILKAVGQGELEPGQAAALVSLVANHGKALELAELDARIRALEGKK